MATKAKERETRDNGERLFHEERKRLILKKINEEGRVSVNDLSEELSISAVTIRNDLNSLAEQKLLIRTHGGAVKLEPTLLDRTLREKEKLHHAEKVAIAAHAATLIQEGQGIVLDSGSTTVEIARAIKGMSNLTVITNALNIALELCESSGIEVILTGGLLRRRSYSVVGHLAEDTLDGLTADTLFLAVDGIDPEFGYTIPNMAEARVNQKMIRIARQKIVVADSSKFGKRSLAMICKAHEVDKVITDADVDSRHVEQLEALGVEVIRVEVS